MKHLVIIVAALLAVAATSHGQTLRTVMVDTNGVQQNSFGAGSISNTAIKIGSVTNTGFYTAFGSPALVRAGTLVWSATASTFNFAMPFAFSGTNATANAATSRTNLAVGLPALTNTSNVTMMRALAGSTNTNEPFSGIIQYADSPTGDTYEMTVSNGIILKTEMQ